MRKIIRANLNKLGIEDIREAVDGITALKTLVNNGEIDLVFTDINMPYLNGIDFIRRVRMISRFKNLDIIIISDQGALIDKAAEEYEISGYVLKPFNITNFNNVVLPILERLKKEIEARNKTKIEAGDMKALFMNEIPQISIENDTDLSFDFNDCSLKIDINTLSEIAIFKAKK